MNGSQRSLLVSARGALAVMSALGAVSCAPNPEEVEVGRGVDNYTVAWNPSSCTIARVLKPRLQVCVRGSGNIAHAQTMTRRALEAWLIPLRARYEGVATDIDFGCTDPDATVNVYPGDGRAISSPRVVLGVYDANPIGTWIHEFGHAFVCLGDTYMGGTAAWCQPGQPRSIMCYGLLLNDITDDDIAGMVHQAERLGFSRRMSGGSDAGTTPDAATPDAGSPRDAGVPDVSAPDVPAAPPPDVSTPGSGPCAVFGSCGACTPIAGCGWCGATNNCISVDSAGRPLSACASGFSLNPPDCAGTGTGDRCGSYGAFPEFTCRRTGTGFARCVPGGVPEFLTCPAGTGCNPGSLERWCFPR